ncbi:hypothetical protein niasHS_016090 [Heterodera schachtii]|uniref:Secreted protein n=1 Tax=Heterodera schachtii TaxID=97005 RepID=A0ABD2IAT5_HETSC
MRQCCCCCAIIVLFSLFVAFFKFNSIDAGCVESKNTGEQSRAHTVNRTEWNSYCEPLGQQECNGHEVHPCIGGTRECNAATINAAPNLTHNAVWDTFCQNNLERCNNTTIKPCKWHTYTNGDQKCVAKRSDRIFV